MELKGKNAVVTGGGGGIGAAISLALADKGANVAVHYFKNKEKAREAAEKIGGFGITAFPVRADIRDVVQVEQMMDEVRMKLANIDILVNNAGVASPNLTLRDISPEEWREVIGVNLTGVFNCCKSAEPELRKNRGKIVNIGSIAGKMGGTIGCHYAASKAGVMGLTFALARELAPEVTVNAVAPGPVDTEFLSPEKKEVLAAQTPFRRIARPEEIAHAVIYLLENDYVSGEVIDVNAGRYMD